jgi:hypothetical protein
MNQRPAVDVDAAEFPDAAIGGDQIGMRVGEVDEMRRADLFFAFDDELQPQRQFPARRLPGGDGGDSRGDVAFVVGDTARPDSPVANLAGPGIALPEIERLGRLDVVVVVKAERFRLRPGQLGVDDRIAARHVDLPHIGADAGEHRFDECCRLRHPDPLRRHSRLPQQRLQVGDRFVGVRVDAGEDIREFTHVVLHY